MPTINGKDSQIYITRETTFETFIYHLYPYLAPNECCRNKCMRLNSVVSDIKHIKFQIQSRLLTFSMTDIRALPVSHLSAAPIMHDCILARGEL